MASPRETCILTCLNHHYFDTAGFVLSIMKQLL